MTLTFFSRGLGVSCTVEVEFFLASASKHFSDKSERLPWSRGDDKFERSTAADLCIIYLE